MADLNPPTSFTLWLEEALTGWILPVAGLVLAGVAGLLYVAGYLPEGTTAAAIAILGGLLASLYVLRPALSARADRAGRALAVAAALGTLFLAAFPAVETVAPGKAIAEGELARRGDTLPLPPGRPRHVRLLVRGQLPQGGTPVVTFQIGGTEPALEGKLERTYSYARVGRGGRAAVAHDHTSAYLAGRVSSGGVLTLDRLVGEPVGPISIAVYPDRVPNAVHWALAVLFLLVAAAAEVRLRKSGLASIAGIAIAFGLLVTDNATPTAAVGTAVGAILLGAITGAAAGGLAAFLAKRVVPAPPEPRGRGARAA
jgi:hypothetical protein